MFHLIDGLPPDVLGVEASGKVTHGDYQSVLIPQGEALMAQGPIKMLYVVSREFSGYDLEALWDDTHFGQKHWHDFKRVAVVADVGWIRGSISLFRPIFPCEVKLFHLAELDAARKWISG